MTVPADLDERGQAIWASFGADGLPAPSRTLVHEIARAADGLDRLDALLAGRADAWVTVVMDDAGNVSLTVDGLLAERRQQQMAFKQLYMEARQAGLKMEAGDAPKDEERGRGAVILNLRDKLA